MHSRFVLICLGLLCVPQAFALTNVLQIYGAADTDDGLDDDLYDTTSLGPVTHSNTGELGSNWQASLSYTASSIHGETAPDGFTYPITQSYDTLVITGGTGQGTLRVTMAYQGTFDADPAARRRTNFSVDLRTKNGSFATETFDYRQSLDNGSGSVSQTLMSKPITFTFGSPIEMMLRYDGQMVGAGTMDLNGSLGSLLVEGASDVQVQSAIGATYDIQAVPEPGSVLAVGLGTLAVLRRRRAALSHR